jgi:hypothetical protein
MFAQMELDKWQLSTYRSVGQNIKQVVLHPSDEDKGLATFTLDQKSSIAVCDVWICLHTWMRKKVELNLLMPSCSHQAGKRDAPKVERSKLHAEVAPLSQ